MRRAPRAIQRADPLAHYPLATELAGVLENDLAVALIVLIEHDAELRFAQELGQLARRGPPALVN